MFLISDNIDTYTGMRLAGVEGVVVHTHDELKDALQKAISNKEIGIILLTEKFGREFPEIIDDFMSHVWGWESDVDVSVIWVHISNIRKKLASMKANVEIRFIRGAGYKLEEANDL